MTLEDLALKIVAHTVYALRRRSRTKSCEVEGCENKSELKVEPEFTRSLYFCTDCYQEAKELLAAVKHEQRAVQDDVRAAREA